MYCVIGYCELVNYGNWIFEAVSCSERRLGVLRRQPHRQQELATLPSVGANRPLVTPISLCRFRD